MKKIIFTLSIIWMMIVFTVTFTNCSSGNQQSSSDDQTVEVKNPDCKNPFKEVYRNPLQSYYIVYDEDTKVEYVVSDGVDNRGSFTVLVDSTGKPKLYKE